MTRRWIVLPVMGFGLISGSVGGYATWVSRVSASTDSAVPDEYAESPGRPSPSVQAYVRASARGRETANQWLTSEIAYAVRIKDLARLLILCNGEEAPFQENEDAALLTCHALLLEDRTSEIHNLRELWRGREKNGAGWLAVDADVLIHKGCDNDARLLLSGRTFAGADEAARLARLALVTREPAEACELLGRAEGLAPGDADVAACRGRRLQAEGRPLEAAKEFTYALGIRGNDWVLRDSLAECYRSAGDVDAAVATWIPGNGGEPADFAWLKAWFWNRVAKPVSRDWEATAPEYGRLEALATYLLALPPTYFWIPDSQRGQGPREPFLIRQETHWLHVLRFLQDGQEVQAAGLVRNGRNHLSSWQPDLEEALDRVLTYRVGGIQPPASTGSLTRLHPFFAQLEVLAADGSLNPGAKGLPDDVKRLLDSDEAVTAAFLAAGWNEAAVVLHHSGADLSRFPAWFGDELIRARWSNRGRQVALQSVLGQRRNASLDLVAGELLLADGRRSEALERLKSATRSIEFGPRAAWLFANEALRDGRATPAREALEAFPQLTNDTQGQLLLARCAAAEGDAVLAERLYREFSGESAEARAYLARRALAGGDWATASQLAGSLLPK